MKANGYDVVSISPVSSKCDHCGMEREWLLSYLFVKGDQQLWVADHCLVDMAADEQVAAEVVQYFSRPEPKWVQEFLVPKLRSRIIQGLPVDEDEREWAVWVLTDNGPPPHRSLASIQYRYAN